MRIFSLLQTKYNQFEIAVKNYLSKTLSKYGASYGNNTVFGQLVNVLNSVVQNIMLYIEDSLIEQNKYTAQRKKSIYGLAAQSGYNPNTGKATGVQLKLAYSSNNVNNIKVLINNKESLTCTQNGLVYNIILPQESIILSPEIDQSIHYLYAVQGKFESQTFISKGGKYYTKNISYTGNFDTDYLNVYVNDEKWDYSASFYDMNPNGKQWTWKISPVGGVDVIFGNDIHGRSLRVDDVVKIEYLIHDGELGNLDINTETYFVFNNPLKDINNGEVDGNGIFDIQFASMDAVTSGSNSESIHQVRQMIGLNSRSLVLASPDNYKMFINRFSFCGYNRTWATPGSLIVNSLIIKNYKLGIKGGIDYFNLKEKDFLLSDQQKSSLINNIENSGQQLAGVSYHIIDPSLCKYAMYLYIKLKSINVDTNYIQTKIRNLIGEFFTDIQSDIFIPKSDIIHLLKSNIPEIDGVSVYILSERNETALQTGYYDKITYEYNPSTNSYSKKIENVHLYPGENPNLGLDEHGNIYLQSDEQFPILMGGWDYVNEVNGEKQEIKITDPLIIVFE